ncbi:MAG: AAA family ATPase [Desulfurococcaceae archaeon]
MLFVLLTGMPGSGKSVVVEAARELGIPAFTMGDVVREETLKRYGMITPELMVKTSRDLREEHGEDVIALRTIERVKREAPGACVVLIDGVRSLAEVGVFRKFGEVVIVAVHASPRTRFKRLLERRRPGDPNTYEDFLKRDLVELGFGLGSVIALADYMIVNEGSLEEAKSEAKRVLRSLVESRGEHCR